MYICCMYISGAFVGGPRRLHAPPEFVISSRHVRFSASVFLVRSSPFVAPGESSRPARTSQPSARCGQLASLETSLFAHDKEWRIGSCCRASRKRLAPVHFARRPWSGPPARWRNAPRRTPVPSAHHVWLAPPRPGREPPSCPPRSAPPPCCD